MAVEEQDTDRKTVKTYIPAYQRDEWDDHAEELDMSRSEFVRSMVQAGRKGYEGSESAPPEDTTVENQSEPLGEPPAAADFDSAVLEALDKGPKSWEALLEHVVDDVEAQLEETLQALQEEDQVRYSGRDGGYVLVE